MPVRIAQVSDAHLSASRPFFAENFARIADAIRCARPAMVLATGDLSLAGADSDVELGQAVAEHAAIVPELLSVPGNHDVGNEPITGKSPSTPERVARWQRLAGPSAWTFDLPGWRLIGYDCQSLDVEPAQWEIIERGIRDAGSRRIALVQHKPLAIDGLRDQDSTYWPVLPDARHRLLSMFGDRLPAVVISGHVHQWRDRTADGIRQIWAPSTAFILGDPYQPAYGSKLIGWVEHEFHADGGYDASLRTVDGGRLDDLGLMPQVYRQLPRLEDQPDLWGAKRG